MQQEDILWNFSPQKRSRDESLEYALSDLAFGAAPSGLGAKVARTRSIDVQTLERVPSQKSIIEMLDFAEHRHMLHVSQSFGDLFDLGTGLECSSKDEHFLVETDDAVTGSYRDADDLSVSASMCDIEPSEVGEVVDEGRFKLVSLLGYRRSLELASAGSRHVASGVPFMSPDAIQHCLVRKPDIVQELMRCF